MIQFFGQQTLAAQYFRPNYLHGAGGTLQDGRSGYWRLFFMQMQEEALKQYEKHTNTAQTVAPIHEATKKIVTTKKAKLPLLVELEEYEPPNFKRRPIYTQETKIDEQLPMVVSRGISDIGVMYREFSKHIIAWRSKEKQQVEAANDADMRIRLLLLAA